MAVPALNPDVAIIHAQQADRRGNVAIWGITGIQKEAVLSARACDRHGRGGGGRASRRARSRSCCRPWPWTPMAVVPHGAHPSYADGYYDRDNAFYEAWDPIGRDRERSTDWMERHVLGVEDFAEHQRSIQEEGAMR